MKLIICKLIQICFLMQTLSDGFYESIWHNVAYLCQVLTRSGSGIYIYLVLPSFAGSYYLSSYNVLIGTNIFLIIKNNLSLLTLRTCLQSRHTPAAKGIKTESHIVKNKSCSTNWLAGWRTGGQLLCTSFSIIKEYTMGICAQRNVITVECNSHAHTYIWIYICIYIMHGPSSRKKKQHFVCRPQICPLARAEALTQCLAASKLKLTHFQ